jgi:hypothetical protein
LPVVPAEVVDRSETRALAELVMDSFDELPVVGLGDHLAWMQHCLTGKSRRGGGEEVESRPGS